MITIVVGFVTPSPSGPSYDPDAQAFFNAVFAAGGSLNTTELNAVNTLVIDLKDKGLWSRIDAAYPLVGGSQNSCKFNLKNPSDTDGAYRLTFNGSWTINSSGVVPASKSSSNYANSHWAPNSRADNNHYYRYINQINNLACDYSGAFETQYYIMGACQQLEWFDGAQSVSLGGVVGGTNGYSQMMTRVASNLVNYWRKLDGGSWTKFTNRTGAEGTLPSTSMYIGTINGADFPEQMRYGFFSYGQGLSDTQATDLDTIVTAFNTSLSRNF